MSRPAPGEGARQAGPGGEAGAIRGKVAAGGVGGRGLPGVGARGRRKRQTFAGRPGEGEEVVFLLLLILFPQLLPRPSSRSPPVWEPPGRSARTMHGLRKRGWLLGEALGKVGGRVSQRPFGVCAGARALGVR